MEKNDFLSNAKDFFLFFFLNKFDLKGLKIYIILYRIFSFQLELLCTSAGKKN